MKQIHIVVNILKNTAMKFIIAMDMAKSHWNIYIYIANWSGYEIINNKVKI